MEAPEGWERFQKQSNYTVGGFYFMNPSMVKSLCEKAGFTVVRHSSPDPSNMYYNRDFVILVEKPIK
jgi:hypothetical protein